MSGMMVELYGVTLDNRAWAEKTYQIKEMNESSQIVYGEILRCVW